MSRQINGKWQIMENSVVFDRTHESFSHDLLATKSIADYVQLNDKDTTALVDRGIIPLDVATDLQGMNATTVATVTGIPAASDLGFIATTAADYALGTYVAKSKVIIRDQATEEPIIVNNKEVFGYLVLNADDTVEVKVHTADGPVALPADLAGVDMQLLARFTLDDIREDFGANEKWVVGTADASVQLNLIQLAKDIYGATWTLDANGVQKYTGSSLYDMIQDHITNEDDAHAAKDISFSGSNGIAATNVQAAIDELKLYADSLSVSGSTSSDAALQAVSGTLQNQINGLSGSLAQEITDRTDADAALQAAIDGVSGSLAAEITRATDAEAALQADIDAVSGSLAAHLAANWDAADAHNAGQIKVNTYSGTLAAETPLDMLAEGSLQSTLENLAKNIASNYLLIDTHMTEDVAHRARNIEVEVGSGTLLASYIEQYPSGTVDLQEFLGVLDNRLTDVSGTLQNQIDGVADDLAAEITRATTAEGALQTAIDGVSGSLVAEVTRATQAEADLQTAINGVSGSLAAEVTRATGVEAALQGEIDALETRVTDLLGVSGSALALSGSTVDGINDVKTALEALDAAIAAVDAGGSNTIAAEIARIEDLLGVEADATDFVASGSYLAGVTVKANLESLDDALEAVNAALDAHLESTIAHEAAHITFAPSGTNLVAEDVQGAIVELDSRVNKLENAPAFDAPAITGGNTLTLTNKIANLGKPMVVINGITLKPEVDFTWTNQEGEAGVGVITLVNQAVEAGDDAYVWYNKVV